MRSTEKLNLHMACDGCLSIHNQGHEVCELGYKIEHKLKRGCTDTYFSKPLERCPKPIRYSHLITIQLSEEGRQRAVDAGVY
jgi:hypothetical protein